MLPPTSGGQGFDAGQAHEIMGPYVEPIAVSILVLTVGIIAGGIGFLIDYRRRNQLIRSSGTGNNEAS